MTDEIDLTGQGRNDEALLAELRAVAGQVDPMPAAVTEAARAAFSWRTIDVELAELTYDSVLDDQLLAGVRGVAKAPRLLTFEVPDLTVEVEVQPAGGGLRLLGQLVPPSLALVHVLHRGGERQVGVDEAGRFSVEQLEHGPAQLRFRLEGGVAVSTPWVVM